MANRYQTVVNRYSICGESLCGESLLWRIVTKSLHGGGFQNQNWNNKQFMQLCVHVLAIKFIIKYHIPSWVLKVTL